jgi:nicotinamidase-related amidase
MTTALLIIDVQHALCTGPDAVVNGELTIANINLLSQKARAAGMPVIFVQHEDQGALLQGSAGWQLARACNGMTTDLDVRKRGSDAFHQTGWKRCCARWV